MNDGIASGTSEWRSKTLMHCMRLKSGGMDTQYQGIGNLTDGRRAATVICQAAIAECQIIVTLASSKLLVPF